MEMGIDGDEPVHGAREEPPEVHRGDRLAVAEACVLAHVRQVRRDEPDRRGAEIPRGGRREEQGHDLAVGIAQRADEHDRASRDRRVQAHVRFAVGKRAHRELADVGVESRRQPRGQLRGPGEGEDDRTHASLQG